MMLKGALALLLIVQSLGLIVKSEIINCDLVNQNDQIQICNIYDLSSNRDKLKQAKNFKYIKSSSMGSLEQIDQDIIPFSIDVKTGNLNWLNKHQPKWTRWSKLCPSSSSLFMNSNSNYNNNNLINNFNYRSQDILNFCSNQLTCDLTGVCEIKFQIDNHDNLLVINLRDNLDKDADTPRFTNDLTFINVTFDLDNDHDKNDDNAINQQVLIESTIKLDSERSKINRILNEFQLNMVLPWINSQHYKFYCGNYFSQKSEEEEVGEDFSSKNYFNLQYDANLEKLFIQFDKKSFTNDNFNKKNNKNEQTCFVFDLVIKRQDSSIISQSSTSIVVVNLIDNRYDRPIFDYDVYNFTIYENSPLDTLIGQVNAIYHTRHNDNNNNSANNQQDLVKYRIVPNVLFDLNEQFDLLNANNANMNNNNMMMNDLPIEINQLNGYLIQKLNIDREKYLNSNEEHQQFDSSSSINKIGQHSLKSNLNSLSKNTNDGLIKLNIESSYLTSMSYGYCKVNIFIKDINDNAPVARIRPVGNFGRNLKLNTTSTTKTGMSKNAQFYLNENTALNQIIAYVGVYDPDAGENGTIKSIDLTLTNIKRPSRHSYNIRKSKYDKLKNNLQIKSQLNTYFQQNNEFKDTSSSSSTSLSSSWSWSSSSLPFASTVDQLKMPIKINKIGDKLFTLQLINKLNYKEIESFTIEMRIQDNGTIPQLESKTQINLNVLNANNYAPIFLNNASELNISIEELSFNKNESIIFKANAIDLDDDKNGQIKYKIVNNPYDKSQMDKNLLEKTFNLNENTGELNLLRKLNRDEIDGDSLELIIMAQDQSDYLNERLNSTIKLNIKIIDLNNNLPLFESNHFNFEIQLFDENSTKSNYSSLSSSSSLESALDNYQKIASSILIKDLDTFETNSNNFYNIDLNKTSNLILQSKTSSLASSKLMNSNKNGPKFLFKDEICLKSFDFNLLSSSSSSLPEEEGILNNELPFLFVIENNNKDHFIKSNVECKMSIWLDLNNANVINPNNNYEFKISVQDYGYTNNNNDQFKTQSKALFNIALLNHSNKSLIDIIQPIQSNNINEIKLNKSNNFYLIEINSNEFKHELNDLFELKIKTESDKIELKSALKLMNTNKENSTNKINSLSAINKFKLDNKNKLSINILNDDDHDEIKIKSKSDKKDLNEVYLLEFYLIKENGKKQLIEMNLILFSNEINKINSNEILNQFHKEMKSILIKSKFSSNKNYFYENNLLLNDKTKSILNNKINNDNDDNSFLNNLYDSTSLIRFQSLLFGSNGDSFLNQFNNDNNNNNNNNNSNNRSFGRLLLSNRTSLIQFIIVTLVISLIVLIVFICCIIIIIKKHCSLKSLTNKKNNSKKPNLNVTDDDIKNINNLNKSNDGFTRIDIIHGQQQDTNATKEKVNRYLDDLDSLITSQHYQNAFFINQNQIELNQNLNYLNEQTKKNNKILFSSSSSNSSSPNSSSSTQENHHQIINNLASGTTSSGVSASSPISSSSLIDSKKSLIIPVNYLQKNHHHHSNNNDSSKAQNNIQKKTATLSTTSSSLMSSDEGCYGSSDFSCEQRINTNDTNNIAIKLIKQNHEIPITFSNSNSTNKIITNTLPNNYNYQKNQQQNYCINNLSRFEKLYNNNNNNNKNDHNVQVITSISGSYV